MASQPTNCKLGSTDFWTSNPELIDPAIRAIECEIAKRARTDSSLFTSFVMQDPDTGKYFRQAPVHEKWHRRFDEYLMNLIMAQRESGKSSQVAARLVWEIGNNPNIRIKYITDTDTMAGQRLKSIADLIENNYRVSLVFPDLKRDRSRKWDTHALFAQRAITGIADPTIGGYGIMGTGGVGGRADLLVFDDVVTLENTIIKPALMPQVKYAYREKWMNTKTKSGRVWYIFTPWHEQDQSHELIAESTEGEPEEGQYKLTVDLVDREKMTSPVPELWPQERLYAKLKEIKERAFMRNFCGKAMSQDESLFDGIDLCCDYNLSLSDIHPAWLKYFFTGVDVGHRSEIQKSDAAYSVIFSGIVTPDGKKIPIEIDRGRWDSPELVDRIILSHKKYNQNLILVENNGYQEAVNSWIRERCKGQEGTIPAVKGYFTGNQKMNEVLGLPGLAVEFENRDWIIPMKGREHLPDCECQFCKWIVEMKMYPVSEFKDQVMACWLFRQACSGGATKASDIMTSKAQSDLERELSDFGV